MRELTTITPTIGLFVWMFDRKGNLLVKKREQDESLPGDWDLPGGGVEKERAEKAKDERIVDMEVTREAYEETRLVIPDLGIMPAMYPVISPGGKDWAFGMNAGVCNHAPVKGTYRYVSPDELEKLVNGPIGDRLVSGYGKRMHRLCLCGIALYSPNSVYQSQAKEKLQEIWKGWNISPATA